MIKIKTEDSNDNEIIIFADVLEYDEETLQYELYTEKENDYFPVDEKEFDCDFDFNEIEEILMDKIDKEIYDNLCEYKLRNLRG